MGEEEEEPLGGAFQSAWMETRGGFPQGPWGCAGTPSDSPIPGGGSGAVLGSLAWEMLGFFIFLDFWLKPKQGVLLSGRP